MKSPGVHITKNGILFAVILRGINPGVSKIMQYTKS